VPEATFWFASPFREWIGQRTVTVRWEGCLTLGEALQRLAAQHPRFRRQVFGSGLNQRTFNDVAAVLMDGNFLSLESVIPDRAAVDVFTPLSGGVVEQAVAVRQDPNPHLPTPSSR
jgi:molybdopterin converting factor small subunit